MPEENANGSYEKTSVHLLDSSTGQPIQTWRFEDCSLIRIGRSEENNIVISDPSVSRFHAELKYQEGAWQVANLGRNGILVGGRSVSLERIYDRTKFRLGASGPLLRFDMREAEFDGMNTITGGSLLPSPAILIDESQKNQQVQEIAESEYFQHLQKISQKLRGQSGKAGTP